MKKFLISAILVSAVCVASYAAVPAKAADNTPERGYITVSYTTQKDVSPDTVEFSVYIRTSDKQSMQTASAKNKEISNKIYDYLKSNITPSNGDFIKTSNYSASPTYIYKDGKRIFEKYEVTNNIIVHTKTLDKVSTLIDQSIKFGATGVNSLNFTLSNKDAQCNEMLSAAGKQLRARADIAANSVGTSVTGIKNMGISCSLNQRSVNYAYSNRVMLKSAGASEDMVAAPQTNIESGNITIYANADAAFYVK